MFLILFSYKLKLFICSELKASSRHKGQFSKLFFVLVLIYVIILFFSWFNLFISSSFLFNINTKFLKILSYEFILTVKSWDLFCNSFSFIINLSFSSFIFCSKLYLDNISPLSNDTFIKFLSLLFSINKSISSSVINFGNSLISSLVSISNLTLGSLFFKHEKEFCGKYIPYLLWKFFLKSRPLLTPILLINWLFILFLFVIFFFFFFYD